MFGGFDKLIAFDYSRFFNACGSCLYFVPLSFLKLNYSVLEYSHPTTQKAGGGCMLHTLRL